MPLPQPANPALIPSVDVLLRDPAFTSLVDGFGHDLVVEGIRTALDRQRAVLSTGAQADLVPGALAAAVKHDLEELTAPSLQPVFNLTGTILHTNLGRAPLPAVAIEALVAAAGAVNLEYDLETGQRGERDAHVEGWIRRLTGAEAAIVVNNNAAAVLLVLNTLALGREAIVSRGELIEIGGAFRMPDIMQRAGCNLREVGTTNRTHLRDYETAIGPDTGLILKVHTSNFEVRGFSAAVAEKELAALTRTRDFPFVVDLGSGALAELEKFGLPHEATVRETLSAGADLVTFSGDKLLGGPQAGIIAGRADLVARLAANPMKRAMRADKLILAALSAVLRLYADPSRLTQTIPALAFLTRPLAEIEAQAHRLEPAIGRALHGRAWVDIVPSRCQIGSGALPVDRIDSIALRLRSKDDSDRALRDLAAALLALPHPVIGRIHDGSLLLDLRALTDEKKLIEQIQYIPQ